MTALTNNKQAPFIFGGNAVFTISSPKGQHYTYKVQKPKDKEKSPYFVKLLTGPNNTQDYTYMGAIFSRQRPEVRLTNASRYTFDAVPLKVINWALSLMAKGKELPDGYALQHEGKCGACGRVLTDPISIETGLSPICRRGN